MKPTCPICGTKQPAVPGKRKYRCTNEKCRTWFETGYDGPASNDPVKSFERTEAVEQNNARRSYRR